MNREAIEKQEEACMNSQLFRQTSHLTQCPKTKMKKPCARGTPLSETAFFVFAGTRRNAFFWRCVSLRSVKPIKLFLRDCICPMMVLALGFTELSWAAPSLSQARPMTFQAVNVLETIEIPSSLARMEDAFYAKSANQPRFIVHIQNVHGHYGAQKSIQELLAYLTGRYQFQAIFLEGGVKELDPGNLKIFSRKEDNVKIAEKLAEQGTLTGAELFLIQSDSQVKAFGVENIVLYRKNYEAMQKVLLVRKESDELLGKYQIFLNQAATFLFPSEVQSLFREWQKFHQGERNVLSAFKTASNAAQKWMGLDLRSSASQLQWPMLARVEALKKLESQINMPRARREYKAILEWGHSKSFGSEWYKALKAFDPGQSDGVFSQRFKLFQESPRQFLERFITQTQPHGFSFLDYPAFARYAGAMVLSSEISSHLLMDELDRLFIFLMTRRLKRPAAEALLEHYQKIRILKALLSLELSRSEWDQIRSDDLMAHIKRLPAEAMAIMSCVSPRQLGKREPGYFWTASEHDRLEKTIRNALDFYRLAVRREAAFQDGITRRMKQHRIERAIFVAGGFHTPGIEKSFKNARTSYLTLSPVVRDGFQEARKRYEKSMLDTGVWQADRETLEAVCRLMAPSDQKKMGARLENLNHELAQAVIAAGLARDPSEAMFRLQTARQHRSEMRQEDAENPAKAASVPTRRLSLEQANDLLQVARKRRQLGKPTSLESIRAGEFARPGLYRLLRGSDYNFYVITQDARDELQIRESLGWPSDFASLSRRGTIHYDPQLAIAMDRFQILPPERPTEWMEILEKLRNRRTLGFPTSRIALYEGWYRDLELYQQIRNWEAKQARLKAVTTFQENFYPLPSDVKKELQNRRFLHWRSDRESLAKTHRENRFHDKNLFQAALKWRIPLDNNLEDETQMMELTLDPLPRFLQKFPTRLSVEEARDRRLAQPGMSFKGSELLYSEASYKRDADLERAARYHQVALDPEDRYHWISDIKAEIDRRKKEGIPIHWDALLKGPHSDITLLYQMVRRGMVIPAGSLQSVPLPSEYKGRSLEELDRMSAHRTLGVRWGASKEEIDRAFQQQVKQLHPDSARARMRDSQNASEQKRSGYQAVVEAKALLVGGRRTQRRQKHFDSAVRRSLNGTLPKILAFLDPPAEQMDSSRRVDFRPETQERFIRPTQEVFEGIGKILGLGADEVPALMPIIVQALKSRTERLGHLPFRWHAEPLAHLENHQLEMPQEQLATPDVRSELRRLEEVSFLQVTNSPDFFETLLARFQAERASDSLWVTGLASGIAREGDRVTLTAFQQVLQNLNKQKNKNPDGTRPVSDSIGAAVHVWDRLPTEDEWLAIRLAARNPHHREKWIVLTGPRGSGALPLGQEAWSPERQDWTQEHLRVVTSVGELGRVLKSEAKGILKEMAARQSVTRRTSLGVHSYFVLAGPQNILEQIDLDSMNALVIETAPQKRREISGAQHFVTGQVADALHQADRLRQAAFDQLVLAGRWYQIKPGVLESMADHLQALLDQGKHTLQSA